ncbi:MAG: NUDIX domain-containing protein, partial [Thermomicrobiales bacterium]
MVRPHRLLYSQRDPVTTRAAATILLLRDAPGGYQVLMTRRSLRASFAPGAFVFPGGAVDAVDGAAPAQALSWVRPNQSFEDRQYAVAAIREAFEELGILLAVRENDGAGPVFVAQPEIDTLDRSPSAEFFSQIAAHDLRLADDLVGWLAQWLTDRDMP